ncbi:MAG: KpsF/GutQ family sugar-phosphate isomerase, partial [Gammaproteobacteria bacterium]|nr:KpsF/GutQ family sugar-phosphate isomerase [Gammaproteobacteria bacterium]
INLDVGVSKEACPHDLAPTSSTTVALVMGDALAVALLQARGFTAEDFALSHPGGNLGRRLLLHVSDIMHQDDRVPKVKNTATVSEALLEMSNKGLGMTAITDTDDKVLGIYTDGDLRRSLDKNIDVHNTPISDVMTKNCRTTTANELAASIVKIMDDQGINGFLVTDENNKLIGAFNMHDVLRAGIV